MSSRLLEVVSQTYRAVESMGHDATNESSITPTLAV
jgi:hypothetical protein